MHSAPGNAGIAQDVPVHAIDANDPAQATALARELNADLVVIGPEAPLVAGVSDALREAGFDVFGPSAAAAQLEGSRLSLSRSWKRLPCRPPAPTWQRTPLRRRLRWTSSVHPTW